MRRSLETNLNQYSRIAKAEKKMSESDADAQKIEAALQWHLSDSAKQRNSTPEAQQQIYELQQQKQHLMDLLHHAFRAIGTPEAEHLWPEGSRNVSFEHGALTFNSKPIDLATLTTDAEWGIFYALPTNAPKHLQKQYLLGLAKLGLLSMLNEQILIDEMGSGHTHTLKKNAYSALRQMDNEGSRFQRGGFIAETLVKNFLTKLSLRFDFDFEITPTDAFDDVENKIDFIIHRKNRYRGVRVEESTDVPKNIGVQFTINKDPDVRIRKQRQLSSVRERIQRQQAESPIEDIVLVQIDVGNPKRMHDEWKRRGSPPGRPDDLWPPQLRQQVFNGLLQDIFTPAELEAQWSITMQQQNPFEKKSDHP